jgi:hypothetical protein
MGGADGLKNGRRPPHKGLQPLSGNKKRRHAVKHFSSSSVAGDLDSEKIHGGSRESDRGFGMELAVLQCAERLVHHRTLFDNPFPNVMTLNKWVTEVWEEAEEELGEADQSAGSRKEVRAPKKW